MSLNNQYSKKKFWVVWNPQGHSPTFRHDTEISAYEEAERLARLIPGQEFIVLGSVASCRKNEVTWVAHDESDIPF